MHYLDYIFSLAYITCIIYVNIRNYWEKYRPIDGLSISLLILLQKIQKRREGMCVLCCIRILQFTFKSLILQHTTRGFYNMLFVDLTVNYSWILQYTNCGFYNMLLADFTIYYSRILQFTTRGFYNLLLVD